MAGLPLASSINRALKGGRYRVFDNNSITIDITIN